MKKAVLITLCLLPLCLLCSLLPVYSQFTFLEQTFTDASTLFYTDGAPIKGYVIELLILGAIHNDWRRDFDLLLKIIAVVGPILLALWGLGILLTEVKPAAGDNSPTDPTKE